MPVSPLAPDTRMRKLEGIVEEMRQLPVNKLKEEMKELQVRLRTTDRYDAA
jgi:hypothetical protein